MTNNTNPARELMSFDVIIVGAGPAGLAAAIRLGQLNEASDAPLSVCVLEKGSGVGAHILSGAILDTRALDELLPNWRDLDAPISTKVTQDSIRYLSRHRAFPFPLPNKLHNKGNYIVRLGLVCQWLAAEAEKLGVSIFPGFPASRLLFNENQSKLIGVGTPDTPEQAGIDIHAKQTLFAEGCRGSLSQGLMQHFNLREHSDPQTYGIGLKELWEVDPMHFRSGKVEHTLGWPLNRQTYGGGFIYHLDDHLVSIGLVIGLDYRNPYLDPFQEFQRYKTHPSISPLLKNGRCIGYGARAINEGGWQSVPKLSFPGGLLIGCSAGFVNVPKIKGTHTAMKSGMLAAERIVDIDLNRQKELKRFTKIVADSWIGEELYAARNIRPGFNKGLIRGLWNAAVDQYVFRGHAPWTRRNHADHLSLKWAKRATPIRYKKPDGVLTFSKLDQVYLTNTHHQKNQPCHLQLKNTDIPITLNYERYAGPEARYCPAGVYEFIKKDNETTLKINAENCIHCKTCDIKDPTQNIVWTTPLGGDGPQYSGL